MSNEFKNNEDNIEDLKAKLEEKEIVKKESVPHFFPTFRIKRNLYSLPIIFTVLSATLLAYIASFFPEIVGSGGYISEDDFGPLAGIVNGLIFTLIAVLSAFIIIFLVKKKGINVLKYVFGFSMGFICFFLTWIFGDMILILILYGGFFPESSTLNLIYNILSIIFLGLYALYSIALIYKYFTKESLFIKNFTILYTSILTGAMLGISMPYWTTFSILIGISIWDLFAVLTKKGPIKQMIDLMSENRNENMDDQIKKGEAEYDTSKLEIGIGDFAFYSMLTSGALIITGNIYIMVLSAIAIIIGTGITIQGLKKNRILPGLPISIFLGIATMLISWAIIEILL
ncbi:MAG: hypothetical protein KGD63_06170 [Candidatus Lokiarchaeota archaeon]|nr:hypothetical protein [Candidatus Lokiarchaeota archaeon]